MLKRIAIVVAAVFGLVAALVVAGEFWLVHLAQSHLVPPSDPANQKSIASYATPVSTEPEVPPILVKDFSWDSIAQPPKSTRPWTRWWWPGGAVDTKSLLAQLDTLDAAGFGGGEVQPFALGMDAIKDKGALDRVYSFDKPAYYQTLQAVMDGAFARGWQLDLTHFSGWPPGGPEINLEDSLTDIVYGETDITGGTAISIVLPKPKPGANEYVSEIFELSGHDAVNFPVNHARILSVVAAKRINGRHSSNPFNLDDTETLDPGSIEVLTPLVREGRLSWNAPAGDWQIIASYTMPSGEAPMGSAQEPNGFVVDHLRQPQVLGHYEYAFGARTGLTNRYGKGFRGIFNDSLEFLLKRMSVDDILQQFKARRGYDLEPYLPAIYVEGADNTYFRDLFGLHASPEFHLTARDDRIRYDYQRTLSDLFIERFVETSARWAESRGLVSRGQSYGLDIDIIRALGANTIPETEQLWAGGTDLVLKMAPSAAALYGRPLASAESFVWAGRDYTTTARKIKAAVDKELLDGINNIIYHGTPYTWRGGEPSPFSKEGWTPFSGPKNQAHFSSIVAPGNTQLWPDIPAVNAYIARSQNLLRQGEPSIDVLIYYPYLGFEEKHDSAAIDHEPLLDGSLPDADPKKPIPDFLLKAAPVLNALFTLPHTQNDERAEWLRQIKPLTQALDRRGITWIWVNAHALETGRVGAGTLPASKGHYQTIVLPNVKAIDQSALRSLTEISKAGTPVYFAGYTPTQQPGFKNATQGDHEVQALAQQVIASGAKHVAFDAAQLADTLQTQLHQAVRYGKTSTIKDYHRELSAGGAIYFFANQSADKDMVKLQVKLPEPIWWFDAEQGVAWPANVSNDELNLSLSGFASRFLIAGVPMPANLAPQMANDALFEHAQRTWSLNTWKFSSDDFTKAFDRLPDWRSIPALAHVRGPGIYTQQFNLENKIAGARYLLNLGLVQGSAAVKVNGQEIGRVSMPPFIVDIASALKPGSNVIEVQVLAPLRNYFIGRALANDPKYSQMKDLSDQLVAAGLMGPVTIAAVMPRPLSEKY